MEKIHYTNLENKGVPLKEIVQIIDSGATPGCSISVVSKTDKLETVSFGYSDNSNNIKVTPHTIYDLASITKLYTTAIVLQLHESDRLSIDDPCSKYLDNFSKSRVTLKDLLTHKVDFDVQLSEYRNKYPNNTSLTTALMKIEPPTNPSNSINYANLGFVYLGKIIEKVEDKSLNATINSLIGNLKLRETYTGVDIKKLKITTPPTEIVNKQIVRNETHDETSRLLGGVAGNAGVFSSAEDLAKFGMEWITGKIIKSDELMQTVFMNYDQTGVKPQAIGWWMRTPTPLGMDIIPDVYSHTGYTGSLLALNLQKGKVCAFTCNRTYYGRDNSKQKEIWRLIINWIGS